MFFRKILKELETRDIKYLVIGGAAVNLHGYNRTTNDLDIMISFDQENVRKLAKMARDLGFKPRVPVEIEELDDSKKREYWKKEKNMKVFSIYNPENDFEIVDIMISDEINFEAAYRNKQVYSDENFTVSIVSIDDLITLKELAARDKDLVDLKILKKLKDKKENE